MKIKTYLYWQCTMGQINENDDLIIFSPNLVFYKAILLFQWGIKLLFNFLEFSNNFKDSKQYLFFPHSVQCVKFYDFVYINLVYIRYLFMSSGRVRTRLLQSFLKTDLVYLSSLQFRSLFSYLFLVNYRDRPYFTPSPFLLYPTYLEPPDVNVECYNCTIYYALPFPPVHTSPHPWTTEVRIVLYY